MNYLLRSTVVAILFLFSLVAGAQESEVIREMVTDRPDETESPSLVPTGFLQIESGFLYEERKNDNIRDKDIVYNTSLLRYGLLGNLELRLGIEVLQTRSEANGVAWHRSKTGFSPLLMGAKIGISEEKGLLPEIGFIGHLHLPFAASEEFRPETTGVDFRFAFTHTVSTDSDLSYNFGAKWIEDASEAVYIYTLAYGYSLTERFGIYAELYGDLPEDDRSKHHWDAGLTFSLAHNLQLDAFAGSGINAPQQLWMGGGFSYRIPN